MKHGERDELLKSLGAVIRNNRELKGWTQSEFANRIGKDQPSLNRLENGHINPGFVYLVEISRGLGIDLKLLLEDV